MGVTDVKSDDLEADGLKSGGRARNLTVEVALVIVALLLGALLRYSVPLTRQFSEGVELRLVDARFLMRQSLLDETPQAVKAASDRVAIIGIDSAATQRFGLGRDVLPRAVHARLVRRLKKAGARAVIFDVVFVDPDPAHPRADADLAAACREAGNVFLPFDDNAAQRTTPALLQTVEAKLSYPQLGRGQARVVRLQPPYPRLFAATRGGGHVVTNADSDGKFRSAILLLENGAVFPHVALDAVRAVTSDIDRAQVELRGPWLHIGERRIGPLEKRPLRRTVYDSRLGRTVKENAGMAWMIPLNFLGNHQVMQNLTVPYLDALEGRADARLKDRIVIIGATATGTTDLRPGPLDTNEVFLGVETNATLIANLLQNSFMHGAGPARGLAAMILAGVLTGLAVVLLRPWAALLLAGGGALIYAVVAMFVFMSANFILEMAGPLLAVLSCYGLPASYRLIVEERAARELREREATVNQLLGQYVDPRLSSRLRDDPAAQRELEIGTRREVTILFSDIRGFTGWSEQQSPEQVSARLDEYFPAMCEIVADDYDGFIDKYIGDALMAVWNVWGDQPDHAARAVRSALSMQRALVLLNDGWRKQGQQEFRIGIGIATGHVVFGSFGSRHKKMPTVLGDTVNLAARLEAVTKETGSNIIISGATYEAVRDVIEARPLGAVPIRGKSEVVQMYEVLSLRRESDDVTNLRFPLSHLRDAASEATAPGAAGSHGPEKVGQVEQKVGEQAQREA